MKATTDPGATSATPAAQEEIAMLKRAVDEAEAHARYLRAELTVAANSATVLYVALKNTIPFVEAIATSEDGHREDTAYAIRDEAQAALTQAFKYRPDPKAEVLS